MAESIGRNENTDKKEVNDTHELVQMLTALGLSDLLKLVEQVNLNLTNEPGDIGGYNQYVSTINYSRTAELERLPNTRPGSDSHFASTTSPVVIIADGNGKYGKEVSSAAVESLVERIESLSKQDTSSFSVQEYIASYKKILKAVSREVNYNTPLGEIQYLMGDTTLSLASLVKALNKDTNQHEYHLLTCVIGDSPIYLINEQNKVVCLNDIQNSANSIDPIPGAGQLTLSLKNLKEKEQNSIDHHMLSVVCTPITYPSAVTLIATTDGLGHLAKKYNITVEKLLQDCANELQTSKVPFKDRPKELQRKIFELLVNSDNPEITQDDLTTIFCSWEVKKDS